MKWKVRISCMLALLVGISGIYLHKWFLLSEKSVTLNQSTINQSINQSINIDLPLELYYEKNVIYITNLRKDNWEN